MRALRRLAVASLMTLGTVGPALADASLDGHRGRTCSVTITRGESIARGVSATPSKGTLCIHSGYYMLVSSVLITRPISVRGVDTGGGLPVIKQSGAFAMFTIDADDVEIAFLEAHGYEHAHTNSCAEAQFVTGSGWGFQNIHDNILDTFTCGINLDGAHDAMIQNNRISTVKYGGIVLSPGVNIWISGNRLRDIGADGQLGVNAYGIVASGPEGSPSGRVTIINNSVVNAPTWECYDAHGGPSIYFFNNYCYRPGVVGISAADANGAVITDSKVHGNTIDAGGLPASQESASIVVTGDGEVTANTIIGEGGCNIFAPKATVSDNICK